MKQDFLNLVFRIFASIQLKQYLNTRESQVGNFHSSTFLTGNESQGSLYILSVNFPMSSVNRVVPDRGAPTIQMYLNLLIYGMQPISFVESKKLKFTSIKKLLAISKKLNHWTNFGPVSLILEKRIKEITKTKHSIIVCSSGTQALFALVNLYNYINNRELKWVTSSFSFPCNCMGPLQKVEVVDCKMDGMLDLSKVEDCDGVVLTNVFGVKNDISEYQHFCKENNKILIYDSAAALNYYDCVNSIVSFHHTKPWGMGEGGCVIVDKKYERTMRSLINFGLTTGEVVNGWATNAKLSDIAAAFILMRLEDINFYKNVYENQFSRVAGIAKELGFSVLENSCNHFVSAVPLIAPFALYNLKNPFVAIKKYYKPLSKTPVASYLYDRIIFFPCHTQIERLNAEHIESCLNFILDSNYKNGQ